jgi:hypothetical protein
MESLKEKTVLFLLLVSTFFVQAQETLSTSGGNATGSGGSVSYTIGQVAYTYQASSEGSVSQGVQQPLEIFTALETAEAIGITLQCIVYPNPTTSNVVLIIENYNIENLMYTIYDINGRSIANKKIINNETLIYMENLAGATYFIRIMDNTKELKTFKIIKK